ncbi:hypothetical protein QOZ80_6BG0485640 [Eleusine coracana subsp. coracana]|nr:hypothetical protein QOZ80_6BG0485640 [Eleusine coracana subsp. coracana]
MEIPVIDLKGLTGEESERMKIMAQLHEACKDWVFFWVENHGVDEAVMESVKRFVYGHYEEHLESKFYASDLAKNLLQHAADQVDWEAAYTIQHLPKSNIADFPEILEPTCSREEWVVVKPHGGNRIFVDIGDQIEVISGGVYKSAMHRVAVRTEGRRLSMATFYNPSVDAIVAPAREAPEYPGPYRDETPVAPLT